MRMQLSLPIFWLFNCKHRKSHWLARQASPTKLHEALLLCWWSVCGPVSNTGRPAACCGSRHTNGTTRDLKITWHVRMLVHASVSDPTALLRWPAHLRMRAA